MQNRWCITIAKNWFKEFGSDLIRKSKNGPENGKRLEGGSVHRNSVRLSGLGQGFLALFIWPLVGSAEEIIGQVTHVRDADTIELGDRTVRLQGIDAPESDQPYGRKATRAMRRKVLDERVRVETHGRGNYGRIIGTVWLEGLNVNGWLVSRGYAWVYDKYNEDPRLPELEEIAWEESRGLWSKQEPVPPWEWRH